MKSLFSLWLTTAALAALSGCGPKAQSEKVASNPADAPITVKVLRVAPDAQEAPIVASGQFTTDDATLLSFKIGGVIDRILVEENQAVRPGQVLATLNLTEIEAGVRQAELAVEKAERDQKRAGKLFKDSVATLEQFQNAQTGLEIAKRQLEAASFNKQYAQITALHAAVVSRKLANPGQVVGPGTPVLQTTGAGAGSWRLRVGLSDREWSRVQVGNSATLETDLPGAKEIPAHIVRKAEVADPINGTYSIELAPNKPIKEVANGLFGKAIIQPKDGVGLVRVPYAALLDGDKGTAFVYVTPDGKTAYKRQVSIAAIEREEALIGSGLKAGDQIIVSGSPYLSEGSAIKIQE